MLGNFEEVLQNARELQGTTISVAVAQDREVLTAVKEAKAAGIASSILVGDAELIRPLMLEVGLASDTTIVHEPDIKKSALTAVSLVKKGEANVVMKGLINSTDFLKAVLDSEVGLRTGRLLCHLAAFEIPGREKLEFHSDGGMNIAPSFEEKRDILINSLSTLKRLGIEAPNVAVLTANEMVNPKMPATVDAKVLAELNSNSEITKGIIEGPIALDVALSPEAAKHKGIASQISGQVDLFILPNIEAGNILGKSLVYCAKARIAGIVIGATNPVVMTSRTDTPVAKLHSIALACLAAR